MWEILRRNPRALYWSLGLHLVFALLLFVSVQFINDPVDAGSKPRVVQASLVGDRALEEMVSQIQSEQAKRAADQKPEERETERRRAAELTDQAEAERRAQAETERLAQAEAQRLAAEEAARQSRIEAERQAQAEAERQAAEERAR
jgi:colicin import membrane protein